MYNIDPTLNVSLADTILAKLTSLGSARLFYKNLYEIAEKNHSKASFNTTYYRLVKRGYLELKNGKYVPTEKGKNYWKHHEHFSLIENSFKSNQPKTTLLAFDVPEKFRRERNWLRNQLKTFMYSQVQKSLWVGPGPLPKEFLARLKILEIKENIKIFRLSKPIDSQK